MSAEKKAAVINLAEADRAAKAFSHETMSNPLGTCPASQNQVFVVPARYALSHTSAEHAALQPGVQPQSHPIAVRRLRSGFVYLWEHQGPLKRYAVTSNARLQEQLLDDNNTQPLAGGLTGFILDKRLQAWLLYTEYPLDAAHCQQLSQLDSRQRYMRQLDLHEVGERLQAAHCPPLSDAEKVVSELLPEAFVHSVAVDHHLNAEEYRQGIDTLGDHMMKSPTPEAIKTYTDAMYWVRTREDIAAKCPPEKLHEPAPGHWSAEPWDALRTRDWLEAARSDARELWPVFACLDDDLGVLRDINHEQEALEARHEAWHEQNTLRLTVGGFIRSLISEDAGEVASLLSYRYRDHNIELTNEQGEILLDAHHQLDELFKEESRINQERGRQYSHSEADILLSAVRERVQATVQPVRRFIPEELHTEVEAVVRGYRAEKVANLENHSLSAKVGEYINVQAMNTWLDQTAPEHFRHVEQRHAALYNDRGLYLKRHHSGTWFADYDNLHVRDWLTQLASACLSGQCLRKCGAEQYAEYVRSADKGALRQLFFAWSPTLEGVLNVDTRLVEILAAMSPENQSNARQALSKLLAPLSEPILNDIGAMARNGENHWNILVKRLSAALVMLKGEQGERFSNAWASIMVAMGLAEKGGLAQTVKGKIKVWSVSASSGNNLMNWVDAARHSIAHGMLNKIQQAPEVRASGEYWIVPWETVTAAATRHTSISQAGTNSMGLLVIGLENPDPDAEEGNQHFSMGFNCGGGETAMALWECVRSYMEIGPQATPDCNFSLSKTNYNGRGVFWGVCYAYADGIRQHCVKGEFEKAAWAIFCIFAFNAPLAFMLQEWKLAPPPDLNHPDITEWSKPLPAEQWAKRSPELEAAIAKHEAQLKAKAHP